MKFTVKDWMVDVVVFVDPDCSVSEALSIMRRRYVTSVIVNKIGDHPEYGIVTCTDISDRIIARNQNPSRMQICEVMTTPVITVNQNMQLDDCARMMQEKKIHHLPVVDDVGEVIGMISAKDFMVVAEAIGREPGDRFT